MMNFLKGLHLKPMHAPEVQNQRTRLSARRLAWQELSISSRLLRSLPDLIVYTETPQPGNLCGMVLFQTLSHF